MLIGFRRRSMSRSRVSRDGWHSGHVPRPYLHTRTHIFWVHVRFITTLCRGEILVEICKAKTWNEQEKEKTTYKTIRTLLRAHVPREDYFTFNDRFLRSSVFIRFRNRSCLRVTRSISKNSVLRSRSGDDSRLKRTPSSLRGLLASP